VAQDARQPLAEDTPLEIEAVQLEIWRRMSLEEKARLGRKGQARRA